MDTKSSTALERRRERRERTLKSGKVWFNRNQNVLDCQVRDMSELGARVKFGIPFLCPERVSLYLPDDDMRGEIRDCEIKWNRGGEVGLVYMSNAQHVRLIDVPKVRTNALWAPPDLTSTA